MLAIGQTKLNEYSDMLKCSNQSEVMSEILQFNTVETVNSISHNNENVNSVNVLVFNMERGVYSREICEFLQHNGNISDFDIILANELDDGCYRSKNINTSEYIGKTLGMNYTFGLEFIELTNEKNLKGFHGNTIFSRFPIIDSGVIHLPQEYNWYFDPQKRIGGRNGVYAVISINNREYVFVSLHLENRTDFAGRDRQMQYVIHEIEDMFKDMPIIIGGDLNTNTLDGRYEDGYDPAVSDTDSDLEPHFDNKRRNQCLEEVFEREPLLNNSIKLGYRVYPRVPEVTRRKPLSDGVLTLSLDWILMKGLSCDECRVISTEAGSFAGKTSSNILNNFNGKELSDHSAVWAMCPVNINN